MLDWDDLRFFVSVAEEGSLAGAGRRLGVDHVTVARRVAALEVSTGLKLVDRRQRKTVLTSDGVRIAAHARRMQDEAFSLERTLLTSKAGPSGDIAVSLPPLLALEWVAPKLADFAKAYPAISLTLTGEARMASLIRREADIAMRLSRPADDALIVRRIGVLRYRLFADAAYLQRVPPTDRRYILFDTPFRDVPHQVWMRSIIGVDPPVVLRSNDLAIQAAAAAAGSGVGVLPEFVGEKHGLVDADLDKRFFAREIWLTWHEDLRGQPAIGAVAEFLAASVPRSHR